MSTKQGIIVASLIIGVMGCGFSTGPSKSEVKNVLSEIVCSSDLEEKAGNFMDRMGSMKRPMQTNIRKRDFDTLAEQIREAGEALKIITVPFNEELEKRNLDLKTISRVIPRDTMQQARFAIEILKDARTRCSINMTNSERKIQEITMLLEIVHMANEQR